MHAVLWQPAASLLLLAASSLVVWLSGERRQRQGTIIALFALLLSGALYLPLAAEIAAGRVLLAAYDLLPPLGLSLRLDTLSYAMIILFHCSGAILVLYMLNYPFTQGGRRFKTAFLLIVACATGVAAAGNIMSFFLFFEVMSLLFFILVIHHRTEKATAAALKFLYMTIGGSVLFFMSTAIIFVRTGQAGWQAGLLQPGGLTTVAFIGYLVAFGIKAAMFPLHLWLADAYGEAPVPAMALSSMIMLKTGAYGLIRFLYGVFGVELVHREGWSAVILILATVTILYGSFCAFAAKDLLRRLAYSGMAQMGYIIFGIALLQPQALLGGIYHIFAHMLMKGTLILCAGAILAKTGKRAVSELAGIGSEMPLTMICFALASLTAVGLPPMNIFLTKWYLSQGALAAGMPLMILVLLASSILNAAYYLPIVFNAFFGAKNRDLQKKLAWDRLSPAMAIPLLLLAAGCIAFNLLPVNYPLQWALNITAGLMP
ncbi:MAG TPA: monovalent cation/H+ antiporter subunit D family protein [Firmicutes bacterium]|nr:monovalent cation/H+ antiporter subunit D family protein [Bacillota bacterium]